jgi:hypothetical protein
MKMKKAILNFKPAGKHLKGTSFNIKDEKMNLDDVMIPGTA